MRPGIFAFANASGCRERTQELREVLLGISGRSLPTDFNCQTFGAASFLPTCVLLSYFPVSLSLKAAASGVGTKAGERSAEEAGPPLPNLKPAPRGRGDKAFFGQRRTAPPPNQAQVCTTLFRGDGVTLNEVLAWHWEGGGSPSGHCARLPACAVSPFLHLPFCSFPASLGSVPAGAPVWPGSDPPAVAAVFQPGWRACIPAPPPRFPACLSFSSGGSSASQPAAYPASLPFLPARLSACPRPCAFYFAGRRAPSPCARPVLPCGAPRLQPGPTGAMSTTSHDPFYSSPFGPFYRRHTSYMVQPEYRIYEMNKRLQVRSEVSARSPASRCASDRLPSSLFARPGSRQLHAA